MCIILYVREMIILFDFAVKYYYNYKNNLPNGNYNYSIGFEDVILLDGSTRRISLPYAY